MFDKFTFLKDFENISVDSVIESTLALLPKDDEYKLIEYPTKSYIFKLVIIYIIEK